MRTFKLVRREDESGVSGTGDVAEGVEFKNGKCVMCWDTETSSIAVYEDVDDLVKIHGHQGKTTVVYDDNGEVVSDVQSQQVIKKPVYRIGDRFVITKAHQTNSNFSEWVGLTGTILDPENTGDYDSDHIKVSVDKPPSKYDERVRYWIKDWLEVTK